MRKHHTDLKTIAVLCALFCVLLLLGCGKKQEAKADDEERVVTVDVAPVLKSPISQKVSAEALLYPLQQATMI